MQDFIRLVGPSRALELFGIRLVGVNAENGKKFLFTVGYIIIIVLLSRLLMRVTSRLFRGRDRAAFWAAQANQLTAAVLLLIGIASIWFDDPSRLAIALGLVTAGLAFALQKAVTALAGYFVILRGRTFNVGDRIRMGGVRGDVIALSLMQTTIMEMGQPPPVQSDDPAMWVHSRQYTGRLVTVTNAVIFDEPVFNYTRDFPYIWEEMMLPIPYHADRRRAEEIIQAAAEHHMVPFRELSQEALQEMERRYFMRPAENKPRTYFRLTDNWLEMTVRFLARDHNIRAMKDAITREILSAFDEAGIGLASATFEIVGLPPLQLQRSAPAEKPAQTASEQPGNGSASS